MSDEDPPRCGACGRTFESESDLERHVREQGLIH